MLLSGENVHCHACFKAPRSQTRRVIARTSVRCSGNGASKQTTIHKLVAQKKTLLIPGVHDALSAKVLAHTGHVSAFVSGYAVSHARSHAQTLCQSRCILCRPCCCSSRTARSQVSCGVLSRSDTTCRHCLTFNSTITCRSRRLCWANLMSVCSHLLKWPGRPARYA